MSYNSYKNLLPKNMRNTPWGELMEVYQELLNQVKEEKVYPINRQFNVDEATEEELRNLAFMFGFDLSIYSGYTQTSHYLIKEIKTIVPRILKKTTRKGYKYILHIFNLIGDVYPTTYDAPYLITIYDYESLITGGAGVTILDQEADNILYMIPSVSFDVNFVFDEATLDVETPVYGDPATTGLPPAFLDTPEFPALDLSYSSGGTTITRHLVLGYKHKFIENANEFLSINTLKALYNDVFQMKRKTEIIHFEPELHIRVSDDNSLHRITYLSFDGLEEAYQYSKLIPYATSFENISTIRLGSGSYTPEEILDIDSLSNIQIPVIEFDQETEMLETNLISTEYDCSTKIIEKTKISYPITEIGFFNSSGHLTMYSTFPTIQWTEKMYASLRIKAEVES